MWRDFILALIPFVLIGVIKMVMDVSALKAEVEDIKQNHLDHIYRRLLSIDETLRGHRK